MIGIDKKIALFFWVLIAGILCAESVIANDKSPGSHREGIAMPEPQNSENRQDLLDAIEEGDVQKTEVYLKQGVDPNVVYKGEYAPLLYYAIKTDQRTAAMVETLIRYGAKATYATEEGYTPLHWLVDINGQSSPAEELKIAQVLVGAGADIEATNHYGWTPLMGAVLEGSLSEMEALLKVGTNPNKKYTPNSMPVFTRGLTPLMVAGSQTDKVKLLLKHGADTQIKNDAGQTAASYLKKIWNDAKVSPPKDREFHKKYLNGLEQSIALVEANHH